METADCECLIESLIRLVRFTCPDKISGLIGYWAERLFARIRRHSGVCQR